MNDAQLLKHLAMNGNCAGSDTELFFEPENSHNYLRNNYKLIQKICGTCPVQQECLDYALRHDVEGIWGGKYHSERRKLRRKLGIKAEPVSFNQYVSRLKDPYHEQLLWEYIDSRKGVCLHGHKLQVEYDVLITHRDSNRVNFHCRQCNTAGVNKRQKEKRALASRTEASEG